MKYFNPTEEMSVGVSAPIKDWEHFNHTVVKGNSSNQIIATCGIFDKNKSMKSWTDADFLEAAECLEQGQLYANSLKMFNMIKTLIKVSKHQGISQQAQALLDNITDISDASRAILGDGALERIEQAYRNK
jgi:predicted oxidoreductase